MTARPSPRTSTRMCRLRPLTFFSPIEPMGAAAIGRLDTLTIDAGRSGYGLAPFGDADRLPESIVHRHEYPLARPLLVSLEHRRPGREVMRELPPRHTAARPVSDCVQDLPRRMLGLFHVRVPGRIRHHVPDEVPFLVGDVGGGASAVGRLHAQARPRPRKLGQVYGTPSKSGSPLPCAAFTLRGLTMERFQSPIS